MSNKQCKTKKELQILEAVEMLQRMQGTFTPHIMYLSKSYSLLSRRLDMEDYFHPSWLEGYDQLMELLHSLTLVYHEHSGKVTEERIREEMKRMDQIEGPHFYEISYRVDSADIAAVKRLVQEIESITGMKPHQVYDSSGDPDSID